MPCVDIAEALAGIVLLDGKTPAQCLDELLQGRLSMCAYARAFSRTRRLSVPGHACALLLMLVRCLF